MRKFVLLLFASLIAMPGLSAAQLPGNQHSPATAQDDTTAVGYVNHVKISRADYRHEVDRTVLELEASTNSSEVSAEELSSARAIAWDHILTRLLIKAEAAKLGIDPNRDSVFADLIRNPQEFMRKQFTDSLGQFHRIEFERAMHDPRNDSMLRSGIVEPMRDVKLFEEWQLAMSAVVLITDPELSEAFKAQIDHADIELLKISPTDSLSTFIPKVTGAQIADYYVSHQLLYRHPRERFVEFVLFPAVLSSSDSFEFSRKMNAIATKIGGSKENWQQAVDALSRDDRSSRLVEEHNLTWAELPDTLTAAQLGSLKPGSIVTTFTPFGARITRITAVSHQAHKAFHARHILIAFEHHSRDSALMIATDLYHKLKNGADFRSMAAKYSEDQSSQQKGGDLSWANQGVFVKEFEAVALKAKLDEIEAPVASEYGYHIIEVLGRSDLEFKGEAMEFTLSKEQAIEGARARASTFYARAKKYGFDTTADADRYEVIRNIAESRGENPIFGSPGFSAQIERSKLNRIIPPFYAKLQHAIAVARVTRIDSAGTSTLSEASEDIRLRLAKQLWVASAQTRAETLHARIGTSGKLDSTFVANSGMQAQRLTIGPEQLIPGIGREYRVNAAAFAVPVGQVSSVIRGENAYYIVKVDKRKLATANDLDRGKSQFREKMLKDRQQRVLSQWVANAKARAEIIDLRAEDE